jgi:hypothetical protein
MAVWPFGRRRGASSGSDDNGNGGGNGNGDNSAPAGGPLAALPLPPSLGEFLNTAPGVAWLAEELSDIHVRVRVPRPPTAREFNALVLQAYHKILSSEAGRRLAESAHARERAAEDVL